VITELGLMFPTPAVVKPERLSPRVSESSDASTSDSSQTGFQVCDFRVSCIGVKLITYTGCFILRTLKKQMMFDYY
jgi:hypothetical protein